MQISAFILVFLIASLAKANPQLDWKPNGVQDGIELFTREVPGSAVIALKGKGRIEAPCWKVASILLDMGRAREWVDSLRESRMVRKIDPHTYIEYNYINTFPIIMMDRDFVSKVSIRVQSNDKIFALHYRPADNAEVPVKGTVRGAIEGGSFQLQCLSPDATRLIAELHADPKGGIAKWIVNFFQQDWPKNTFTALRKQAAKADIRIPADFSEIIASVKAFYLPPKKHVELTE